MKNNPGTLRVIEILGIVIIFVGLMYWFSTPRDVIVGPVIVIAIGAATVAVPWWIRRNQTNEDTSALADRVRREREQSTEDRPKDG